MEEKTTIDEKPKEKYTEDSFVNVFRHNGYGDGVPMKTLREIRMMNLSSSIRRKERWYEKYKDQTILDKWINEAKESAEFTDKMISYVVEELKYYDSLRDETTGIEVADVDGVWISDRLINQDLKQKLIKEVSKLENVPDSQKLWHPNSNNQVLDLVHPSLYPLVYNTSLQLPEGSTTDTPLEWAGGGSPLLREARPVNTNIYFEPEKNESDTFSWLPSEFFVDNNGKVKINSYINNLHPVKSSPLYSIIGEIFELFIPLFDNVIRDLLIYDKKEERIIPNIDWYERDDGYQGDEQDDDAYREYIRNRRLNIPEPSPFKPPIKWDESFTLKGRELQVIVKLANIELTPDKPTYAGGVWHIEGMKNESIVASGIYYYSTDNITESELAFRAGCREPYYEQDDVRGVETVYGILDRGQLGQVVGSVITKEDRCISFPNVLQHKVSPFELLDKSKSGFRKILVFFLVNPFKRIPSTATIPPQRLDWFMEELKSKKPMSQLPLLVLNTIAKYISFPASQKQAEEWMNELMEERKAFVAENTEHHFTRTFSLCEH